MIRPEYLEAYARGLERPPRFGQRVNAIRREDDGFRIETQDQAELLDIGTIALIRQGKIAVRPGIDRLDGDDVVFTDGQRESFAAIVLATGYRPALEEIVADAGAFTATLGTAAASAAQPLPGLFLCGFYVSPTGMLRQIAGESRSIADAIAAMPRA